MARLLHRLGAFSARRPWLVIVTWLVILIGAGGAWFVGHGPMSSEITVPGTATEKVSDRLSEILDTGDDGGSADIVVRTESGGSFTEGERDALAKALDEVADIDGVASVTNPFIDAQTMTDRTAELEAAAVQLSAAQDQVSAGEQQLATAIAEAKASGTYDLAADQFEAQAAQLEESKSQFVAQWKELDEGRALLRLGEDFSSVSESGAAAIAVVTFEDPAADVSSALKEDVRKVFEDEPIAGVQVDFSTDLAPAAEAHGASSEAVGILIAAVVLIIMLGTLIVAGLPLLNALLGVGVSVLIVLAFSSVVEMSDTTPVLGLMLGLAVGIDYTLFIVDRHRRHLRDGMEVRASIALANGTSGTAVVFAGATVIIALLALWVTGIPFLGMMGVAGAAAILAAVLVAVTLTPALLSLIGSRALSKRSWARIATASKAPAAALKPMSTARAVTTVIASVIGLGLLALPALQMRLGLPDGSSESHSSTQYRAFDTIESEFGPGRNSPLIVVADLPAEVADDEMVSLELELAEVIDDLPSVSAIVPITGTGVNTVALFQVLPVEGAQAESTEELVHTLRGLTAHDDEITFEVAGAASGNIDISEKIADALPPYLAIVIGLSILIMIVVFRSILVPLVATGGFVLSLVAALGGVTAIYQFGWAGAVFGVDSTGPVLSILPTMLVGILFGLAMDYQIFIASGIREAFVHGSSARLAVVEGVRGGRAVVTAAAIIMAAVFGGFIFGDSSVVRPLGFGLAFGVLLDAFVVRMLLVPAALHLLGKSAWWIPRWLDRLLPDIDIEGASLRDAVDDTKIADNTKVAVGRGPRYRRKP